MLIRSQDKIDLLNINNVFNIEVALEDSANGDGFWHLEVIQSPEDYDVISIGSYSSKEKALKAMDMLEEAYKEDNVIVPFYKDYGDVIANNPSYTSNRVIFHMPQDKEVEV